MPNTQELRRRIKSIKNTRQITKAMEMVAASKMRRAQETTLASRSYARQTLELLKKLSEGNEGNIHPLLDRRGIKSVLAIVITSDKGLCGGYNSQLLKVTLDFLEDNKDNNIEIVAVGKRGEQFLKRLGVKMVAVFSDFPTYPEIKDVSPISFMALNCYAEKKYDQVAIVYTEFSSMLKQEAQVKTLLPISLMGAKEILEEEIKDNKSEYIFEPDEKKVLDYVLPKLSEIQIYHAVLESIASEQSARMMAMKNASDNAGELIDDLTLTYNSIRQASITQELAEVSGGSEAVK